MATVRKEVRTSASPGAVWDAIRDLAALHTRLVPGFVADTRLEPGARVVRFANGLTVREPIVTVDEEAMRLVWTVEGLLTTHYNSAVQAFAEPAGTRVVWVSDFLPDEVRSHVEAAMEAGARAMKASLDRMVDTAKPA